MVETEAEREGALQRIENVLVSLGYSMKDTTRHSYLSMLTDQTCAMEVAHNITYNKKKHIYIVILLDVDISSGKSGSGE